MLKGKFLVDIEALEEEYGSEAGFAYLKHKAEIENRLKDHKVYKKLFDGQGKLNTDSLLWLVLELIEQVEKMNRKLSLL